ncbi:hypothetical protein B0H17DRAFT_1185986 [Mycena rosella]|uniref:DUF6533 domain-containing protein n=1 Tax=Mycena rosella TaxID=1033263 RepID=A0AAD7CP42_MYCRO|nr:hypothetical protein B0H17DRAFT_1185986 [Mycena rosella]
MDPADLKSIIVALQNVATTRYMPALLYDHALTLDDEVEYIWSAPSTVAKVLFLVLRYMVPLLLLVMTITRSGIPVVPMSATVCKGWTAFATFAGWLSIVISNFLVLLRIWTTLPRGHKLIRWSIVFFVAVQLTGLGVTTWVIAQMIPVLVFEPLVGLCTFTSKPNVVGLWVVGLIFEVVVFLIVCWNTLDRPRTLGSDSEVAVTRLLFRDGVVYFVILFVLRVSNVVIAVAFPVSSIFIIVFFIWSATTLTTSRLIINSRRAVGKAAQLRAQQMEEILDGDDAAFDTQTDDSHGSLSGTYPRRSRSTSFRV